MDFYKSKKCDLDDLKKLINLKNRRNFEQELEMVRLIKKLIFHEKYRVKTFNLLALGYGKNEIGATILGPTTGIIIGPKFGNISGYLNRNRLGQIYESNLEKSRYINKIFNDKKIEIEKYFNNLISIKQKQIVVNALVYQ